MIILLLLWISRLVPIQIQRQNSCSDPEATAGVNFTFKLAIHPIASDLTSLVIISAI